MPTRGHLVHGAGWEDEVGEEEGGPGVLRAGLAPLFRRRHASHGVGEAVERDETDGHQ